MPLIFKELNRYIDPRNFLDINNPRDYVLFGTDYNGPADFILDWTEDQNFQHILIMALFHGQEDETLNFLKWVEDDRVIVLTTSIDYEIQHNRIIFTDYMFNRTKAYHQGYQFSPDTNRWYYHKDIDYQDFPASSNDNKNKIFIAPIRTFFKSEKHRFRNKLLDHLCNKYRDLGYIGNPNNNIHLYNNSDFSLDWHPRDFRVDDLANTRGCHGYVPPHVAYYRDSFVSIYGETIEFGSTYIVSEKTYVPLIRGHFILPFSNRGFIGHLKSIGVRLPSFIDYSYDDIEDYDRRMQSYFIEVDRLLALDLDTWCEHWNQNIDLIRANQRWFDRDYHRIDLYQYL
jgi:hypothetical protein